MTVAHAIVFWTPPCSGPEFGLFCQPSSALSLSSLARSPMPRPLRLLAGRRLSTLLRPRRSGGGSVVYQNRLRGRTRHLTRRGRRLVGSGKVRHCECADKLLGGWIYRSLRHE